MDTIVAPITPMVESSVILIRVSGVDSLKILQSFSFPSKINNKNIKSRHVYFCEFISEDHLVKDEVLLYYFKAPHAYTGEDVIEISFHGNPLIVNAALNSFYRLGIRNAEPGEFTKRAFLNGKIDLTQAEGVLDVIRSKSKQGLFYSYNQLKGVLRDKVAAIKDIMVGISAVVESYIDFPEEEIPIHHLSDIKSKIKMIHEYTAKVLNDFYILYDTRDAINIVIAGKPNVGKSSLLNYFSQEERAITSDLPGTTRDYISKNILLNNLYINLIDTAGIRTTSDDLEKIGVERSIEQIKKAEIVIVLLDMSALQEDEDIYLLKLTDKLNRVVVGNKADNPVLNDQTTDINISVKTGYNIEGLLKLLSKKMQPGHYSYIDKEVLISERHKYYFEEMLKITEDLMNMEIGNNLDLCSVDLQRALNLISEITGEVYTEDILDTIFSKFCVGK